MTKKKMRTKMKLLKQPKVDYQNVYEDNRRITYMCWCGLLVIILTIWIGSCGYVTYYGNEPQIVDDEDEEEEEDDFIEFLRKKHNAKKPLSSTYVNMFFYISLIIILINMIPIKVYQKLGTNFLMVFIGLIILFLIVHIGLYFVVDSTKYKKIMFWVVPEAITILVCILSTYFAALCNNTTATSGFLKRISRFYLFYRHLITFGLFLLMSILYLETFTMTMLEGLGPKNILFYTILGGSCYIILFLFYFGAFVISATTATYYWTQNNEKCCPIKAFFHATISVIKYHLGAVCFNATAVLPPLVAAFAILKSEFDIIRGFSFVLSTISVAEDSARSETAKIIYDRRKSSFRLFKNTQPMSRLKGVQLIWIILGVVLFSTNIIMVFLRWERNEDDPIFSWAMITSYSNIIGLWLPFILLIDIIIDSIIIYVMEKDRESEMLSENQQCQTLLDTAA